jgi:endo-1,4-beta-xylanase
MQSLRERFADAFEMGVALGGMLPDDYSPAELELIRRHFGNITPENCMKASLIHPEEGRFSYALPDALVSFAKQNRMNVTGHCLVWHQQCPDWIFHDQGKPASRELVLRRMREHIRQVLTRYRSGLQGIDVVNEAIDDGADYICKSKWTQHVGDDYVEMAFRYACEFGDGVRLYYNDYNIEMPAKREKTIRLVRDLKGKGLRVDAIGIQGHWMLDQVPLAELDQAISAFAALGCKVMITELDLDVVRRETSGANPAAAERSDDDPFVKACSQDVLKRQAQQYKELFRLFEKQRQHITRVAFWGLHDGRSWLNSWPRKRTNHPLFFDRQSQPKPAVAAVLEKA